MTEWTSDRVKTLERMWHDGCSATEIARALGGVTRNAVIGKITRLGLQRATARSAPSAPRSFPSKPRSFE